MLRSNKYKRVNVKDKVGRKKSSGKLQIMFKVSFL